MFVRTPYQMCAEMLPLVRTQNRAAKMVRKTREITSKISQKADAWGVPRRSGGRDILFLIKRLPLISRV